MNLVHLLRRQVPEHRVLAGQDLAWQGAGSDNGGEAQRDNQRETREAAARNEGSTGAALRVEFFPVPSEPVPKRVRIVGPEIRRATGSAGPILLSCAVPEIHEPAAVLAEFGSDPSVFSSTRHSAAGAGLAPGNHVRVGKRRPGRARRENIPRWERRMMDCARGRDPHRELPVSR